MPEDLKCAGIIVCFWPDLSKYDCQTNNKWYQHHRYSVYVCPRSIVVCVT